MTKIKLCSVLFLAVMSWSTNSFAVVINFGATDCGTWINQSRITDRAWAVGFISGVNASLSTEKNDILGKNIKSGEQVFLYVDNYCRNNPLSGVQDALGNLWVEIRQK